MYGINCGVSILAIKIGFCDRLFPHQTAILKFMKFGSLEKNFYPIILSTGQKVAKVGRKGFYKR